MCGRGKGEGESWQEDVKLVLGEDGEMEWWLRNFEELRKGLEVGGGKVKM